VLNECQYCHAPIPRAGRHSRPDVCASQECQRRAPAEGRAARRRQLDGLFAGGWSGVFDSILYGLLDALVRR